MNPKWLWIAGVTLAAVPALSFLLQLFFSFRDDTLPLLFGNYTISYIDWVFVPFNFFVVYAVNWRRGGLLLFLMGLSLVLNICVHAYWQSARLDNAGHMIQSGVVLDAGWVHLGYATIQTTLIGAYLFVREPSCRFCGLLTVLCLTYFFCGGVSGYILNNGFMITDVLMVTSGLACTFIYPRFAYAKLSPQT